MVPVAVVYIVRIVFSSSSLPSDRWAPLPLPPRVRVVARVEVVLPLEETDAIVCALLPPPPLLLRLFVVDMHMVTFVILLLFDAVRVLDVTHSVLSAV